MLVFLCIVTAILEIGSTAASELSSSIYRYNKNVPIVVWLLASAAIMASLHWKVETAEFVGKMAGICKLMGKVTYPLYLVHYQTGGPIFAALIGLGWSIWAAFIPAYLTALGISVVIVRYFEPPLAHILKQWLENLPLFGTNPSRA